MKLQGIFPALATPFDHNGEIYKTKVLHNVDKLNRVALSGYTVCGSTGETPLLSAAERLELLALVKQAAAPEKILIAGVGVESVHETVAMANHAQEIGFHVALVLGPSYYKTQMYRPETQTLYFRAVADRSKLPVLVYNIPQVTGYDIPVDVLAELSHHPNIIGMKDSSGNMDKMRETVKAVKPGFQIMCGAGGAFYEAFQIGAAGAILAIANPLPYACVTIWEAFRTRQDEAGKDWQARILPAAKLMATKHGIPGIKYAMDLNGYYGGPPRLPFVVPTPEAKTEIETVFDGLKG
jgi:4-hydroxy-2-oxoglutarate aldolase